MLLQQVAVDKLTVRLLPWDAGVEAAMQAAGYNPFLEITCRQVGAVVRWCMLWHSLPLLWVSPHVSSGAAASHFILQGPPTTAK